MNEVESGPHYELPSTELAAWIEAQGEECYWSVDGDPLLTGRISFPCPGDVLAADLRYLNRPLLLADKDNRPEAKGQLISAKNLDALAGREPPPYGRDVPETERDRFFFLAWKGKEFGWFLNEDKETAALEKRDAMEQGA